jgi:hypothetical protein
MSDYWQDMLAFSVALDAARCEQWATEEQLAECDEGHGHCATCRLEAAEWVLGEEQ